MFNLLLSEEERSTKAEARRFAKDEIPSSLIRSMDKEDVRYPREFIEKLAFHNLLGLRFPRKWGGRGMKWTGEVAVLEELGVLGSSLVCLYSLVSIVGEAINTFGTEEQKENYLRPTLEGKLCCAEALTEPRGGSDFFGATTIARKDGDHYVLNGQKRFVVGAERKCQTPGGVAQIPGQGILRHRDLGGVFVESWLLLFIGFLFDWLLNLVALIPQDVASRSSGTCCGSIPTSRENRYHEKQ